MGVCVEELRGWTWVVRGPNEEEKRKVLQGLSQSTRGTITCSKHLQNRHHHLIISFNLYQIDMTDNPTLP
jgi:hypothetical protein